MKELESPFPYDENWTDEELDASDRKILRQHRNEPLDQTVHIQAFTLYRLEFHRQLRHKERKSIDQLVNDILKDFLTGDAC